MAVLPNIGINSVEHYREWAKSNDASKDARSREVLLRQSLFSALFPTPTEGSAGNKYSFGVLDDGKRHDIKGTFKINRTIDDEAKFFATCPAMREAGIAIPDLFRFPPVLNLSAYRALSDEQRLIVDTVLKIEPGTPSLEIVISEAPAAAVPTPAAPVPVAANVAPIRVMLEKSRAWSYEELQSKGWTDQQLIEAEYMRFDYPAPAPVAAPAPAVPAPSPAVPPAPAAVAVPAAPAAPVAVQVPKVRGLFVDQTDGNRPYELFDAECLIAKGDPKLTEVTDKPEWEAYFKQWQEYQKSVGIVAGTVPAATSSTPPATGEKPKRTRRTKAQIEADRAAGGK